MDVPPPPNSLPRGEGGPTCPGGKARHAHRCPFSHFWEKARMRAWMAPLPLAPSHEGREDIRAQAAKHGMRVYVPSPILGEG